MLWILVIVTVAHVLPGMFLGGIDRGHGPLRRR